MKSAPTVDTRTAREPTWRIRNTSSWLICAVVAYPYKVDTPVVTEHDINCPHCNGPIRITVVPAEDNYVRALPMPTPEEQAELKAVRYDPHC